METRKRRVISLLVDNQSGVLARVSSLFCRRGFNIDSLTVSATNDPTVSRITVTVSGSDKELQQLILQTERLEVTRQVFVLDHDKALERELLLLKVEADVHNRAELREVGSIYKAKIIDLSPDSMVFELIGKPEKIDAFLKMFEDNITATSTLMLVFFGTIMAILGEDFMRQIDSGFAETTAFPVYILIQSLYFTVYLQILNMGVKLFVGELTASFKGISDKLLPGAVPAVDCAVAFNYAPGNAVTIGFLCGMVGQVIAILGLIVFHSPVIIIMGFTTVFFDNAIIAIFANKRGGVKAAMIIPFICGLIQVLLGAVTVWLVELVPYGGWHGTTDFSTVWLGISALLKCLGLPGAIIAIILMLLVPQIQYAKSDKENYF